MKKITTEAGIESLCIAVLQRAAYDYFLYRNTLENPKANVKKKITAKADLDDLKNSFKTGQMDLYTMVLDNMSGMDVLNKIKKAYEEQNTDDEKAESLEAAG